MKLDVGLALFGVHPTVQPGHTPPKVHCSREGLCISTLLFFFQSGTEVFFGTGFFDLRGGEVFFGLQKFSRASRAKPLEKLVRGGFLESVRAVVGSI